MCITNVNTIVMIVNDIANSNVLCVLTVQWILHYMRAATNGKVAAVELLLRYGAAINQTNSVS